VVLFNISAYSEPVRKVPGRYLHSTKTGYYPAIGSRIPDDSVLHSFGSLTTRVAVAEKGALCLEPLKFRANRADGFSYV